ncbi:MAG: DNA-processing protein DprA [Candidatus Levybacteria bacterium]|nr:DNA-processing protein DprA [Candidatus Levybacteria bacterium]MSU26231.1 DNA-protecting protein DprA [Candidatus Levybacteria bacterium]
MEEREYYLGFSVFPGIGPVFFGKLITRFKNVEKAWNAPFKEISMIIGENLALRFISFRDNFSFQKYLDLLKRKDVWFLTLIDKEYPFLLKSIKRPPFVLYGKGKLNFSYEKNVAIVGTRKITTYGRQVTELLTRDLVQNDCVVVSGLAIGVDAVAHATALENNGKTIAVLGCGVDCCSPQDNQNLYNRILAEDGVIISELPIGHSPTKGSFPARNRIIAGLSKIVLVTEGDEDSGALITADNAFIENRPVFAVPGPITSQLSKGSYKLIAKGAKLAISAKDILQELDGQSINNKNIKYKSKLKINKDINEEEKIIINLLKNETMHFDELVKISKMNASKLGGILSIMEIKGIVSNLSDSFALIY